MENHQFEEINRRIDSLQASHLVDQSEVKKVIQDLSDIIKPMAETYAAATRIGKWTSGFLVFISVGIGIALALRDLFRKQ